MSSLIQKLAPDVMFYGDNGGVFEGTFVSPLAGRDRVAEMLRGSLTRIAQLGAHFEAAWVNRQPGLIVRDAAGVMAVIAFDVLDGQVQAIRTVANPDKLRHLGPVSRTWHPRRDD